MQTKLFFWSRRCHPLAWLAVVGLLLSWPAPLLADAALGIGLLGGAMVGTWFGLSKNRGQNALFGAGSDGTTVSRIGVPVDAGLQRGYYGFAQPPTVSVAYTTEPTDCRQMETQGFVDGRQENLVGLACRHVTGAWQFQETPRVVQRTVVLHEPGSAIVEPDPQTVTGYPAPNTLVVEPQPVVVSPGYTYGGHYYGHRDSLRDRQYRHSDW